MSRTPRPRPWRPAFLDSAAETAELAAELAELAESLERESRSGAHAMTTRERARVSRLQEWTAQLDERPANGQSGGV